MLKACALYINVVVLTFVGFCLVPLQAQAYDDVSVVCDSPTATASTSGGTTFINVNCTINAPNATSSYRITGSANNFLIPSAISLNRGLYFLTANLLPTVTSPDNTVTSISGTSSGFTAQLTSSSTPKNLRFQYSVATTSNTPAGLYSSLLGLTPAAYWYRICTTPSCGSGVFSGGATAHLKLNVSSTPTTVSCSSQPGTAPAGGGTFILSVDCTISGSSSDKLSPSSQNVFSPTNITLTGSNNTINAALQPLVTSPDSSVTSISGTAGGGFTGNVTALPARIQVQYQGTTTELTRAGTYTSTPVVFIWSVI